MFTQLCLQGFDRSARRIQQVDPVEIAAPIEFDLCGVNIHHRNVPTENLPDSFRLEETLHGEILAPVRSEERQGIADSQAVAVREGARNQNRVRLRDVYERIRNL